MRFECACDLLARSGGLCVERLGVKFYLLKAGDIGTALSGLLR
jgi:hypothetical protein